MINTPTNGMDTTMMQQILENDKEARALRIIGERFADAISNASSDEAWAAIEAFNTPERARLVMAGKLDAYIHELYGAAQAMHMSAADFFEGV